MSFFSGRRNDATPEHSTSASTQSIGFETVLGESSVLDGTFKAEGNVRLDGTFSGTLDITGNVLVGEGAQINADIEARNISIAGEVRGNVTGHKVQLLRTGRIWGDIHAGSLTTEEGAFIDGKISMTKTDQTVNDTAASTFNETQEDPTVVALDRQDLLDESEMDDAGDEGDE